MEISSRCFMQIFEHVRCRISLDDYNDLLTSRIYMVYLLHQFGR
uniref:Uncharacterized protein n=1 Tax=Rhizophora mucronata TaxID=61149 RepID=A0A2P2PLA3_RHIMU